MPYNQKLPRIAWKITVNAGERFGRLTVIRELPERRSGHRYFECQCECGKVKEVMLAELRYGGTKSCGCLAIELTRRRSTKHGRSNSSIYHIWRAMVDRCHLPTSQAYPDYGGRGIRVCDEWRKSFPAFLASVGERPDGKSLDRIDNSRGYEPENVRWTDNAQQTRNKRSNVIVEYEGKKLALVDAARISGVSEKALRWRVAHGWSGDRLFSPVH